MTTQLAQVLKVLSDGNWHSLPDISQTLKIRSRSAGSRIRDLRLSAYGKHQIEVRKTGNHRVYEYRLTKAISPPAQASTLTNSAFGSVYTNVLLGSAPFGQAAPFGGSASYLGPPKPVKFFNTQTLGTEYIPHNQCSVETVDGYRRIVAKDSAGKPIPHLITTQENL